MKLIEAKCPKCKKLIEVDGDSETSKCNHCGEKIDVKDALVEKMMSEQKKEEKKIFEIEKEEEIVDEVEDTEETTEEEKEEVISPKKSIKKIINTIDEEENEEYDDDDDDDYDDDDDDDNDYDDIDDDYEIDEKDFEEKIMVEEEKPEKKVKERTTKKTVSKKKNEEIDELLEKAEKLLKKEDGDAYNYYQAVLEIDPSDTYCKYRSNYMLFWFDYLNKEKLMNLYEAMLDVDYCFNEEGEKTEDISFLQEDFADCVIKGAYAVRKSLIGNTNRTFDNLKKSFNSWYSDLFVLEKFAKEDLDEDLKAKVYIYILVIINYLKDKYYYRAKYTTSFQDKEHLETLKSKHSKYKGKLAKINPYYEKNYVKIFSKILDKIKDPYHKEALEEKKNSKSIMDRLDYFYDRHPVLSIILIVISFFAFILIFTFIKDLLAGNI